MNQTQTTEKSWHGSLQLVYADRANTTKVIRDRSQAPLKIQRPFYPEGTDICHSVILHTAGGIVGGDQLSLDFHLQSNAKALITTAAASKIYRSNGLQANQNIQIKVDSGAYLEWLPQETIIFNGAIYRQDLRVELAPSATFLTWDITRFGRTARGEKFSQGEARNYTEIWQQGKPLWIDRQWLPGSEEIINNPHSLAGKPIVASLIWVGQTVSPEIVQKARILWERQNNDSSLVDQPSPLLRSDKDTNPTTGEAGVTRLMQGLLCRYRGNSTSEVRNWFKDVWHLLRQSYLGRPSCPPRVWPL